MIWQRKGWAWHGRGGGVVVLGWGVGGVGVLPVALAPTGNNLEQTVPNVFIRL